MSECRQSTLCIFQSDCGPVYSVYFQDFSYIPRRVGSHHGCINDGPDGWRVCRISFLLNIFRSVCSELCASLLLAARPECTRQHQILRFVEADSMPNEWCLLTNAERWQGFSKEATQAPAAVNLFAATPGDEPATQLHRPQIPTDARLLSVREQYGRQRNWCPH